MITWQTLYNMKPADRTASKIDTEFIPLWLYLCFFMVVFMWWLSFFFNVILQY